MLGLKGDEYPSAGEKAPLAKIARLSEYRVERGSEALSFHPRRKTWRKFNKRDVSLANCDWITNFIYRLNLSMMSLLLFLNPLHLLRPHLPLFLSPVKIGLSVRMAKHRLLPRSVQGGFGIFCFLSSSIHLAFKTWVIQRKNLAPVLRYSIMLWWWFAHILTESIVTSGV